MTDGATQMHSRYVEYAPPPALAGRVVCFWTETVSDGPGAFSHGVLPDGCVDLIWVDDAPPKVAGPATRRTIVHLPAGSRLFGVRLSPGWAGVALGHAAGPQAASCSSGCTAAQPSMARTVSSS